MRDLFVVLGGGTGGIVRLARDADWFIGGGIDVVRRRGHRREIKLRLRLPHGRADRITSWSHPRWVDTALVFTSKDDAEAARGKAYKVRKLLQCRASVAALIIGAKSARAAYASINLGGA
jgi:hypothetical protein